jgi:hypothetical protein
MVWFFQMLIISVVEWECDQDLATFVLFGKLFADCPRKCGD